MAGNYRHGLRHTRIYTIWRAMRQRCNNPHCINYKAYGGKGIKVCDEWQNPKTFAEWAFANGYSDSLTLDRIDVSKGYTPDNCRWTTAREQSRNRRSNIPITIGNTTKTLTEWCEIFNLDYRMVNARYKRMEDGVINLDKLFKG